MTAFWGIAAHSAYMYDMFSWYKYLSVILFFPTPRFVELEFLSDAPFADHCLLVPFHSADYIFRLALRDQRAYSANSENFYWL